MNERNAARILIDEARKTLHDWLGVKVDFSKREQPLSQQPRESSDASQAESYEQRPDALDGDRDALHGDRDAFDGDRDALDSSHERNKPADTRCTGQAGEIPPDTQDRENATDVDIDGRGRVAEDCVERFEADGHVDNFASRRPDEGATDCDERSDKQKEQSDTEIEDSEAEVDREAVVRLNESGSRKSAESRKEAPRTLSNSSRSSKGGQAPTAQPEVATSGAAPNELEAQPGPSGVSFLNRCAKSFAVSVTRGAVQLFSTPNQSPTAAGVTTPVS